MNGSVLAMVLVYIVLPIAVIAMADAYTMLQRKAYAFRTIPLLLAGIVVNALVTVGSSGGGFGVALFSMIIGAGIVIMMFLWSVYRTQDLGWSKWWCLLILVPFVGLVYWLALLFVPRRVRDVSASAVPSSR